MESEIYSINDVCKMLELHRLTVTKFARQSKFWFKIGWKYRLKKIDFDNWINEMKINKSEIKK